MKSLITGGYSLKQKLIVFWRELRDKCKYCGGDLYIWSIEKAVCKVCGKDDR